jgi:hypothetical protein
VYGKISTNQDSQKATPAIIRTLDRASKAASGISLSELPSLSLKELNALNQVPRPSFMPESVPPLKSQEKSVKMPRLTTIGAAGLLKAQKMSAESDKEKKDHATSVLSEHVKKRFRNPYQNI